MTILLQKAYIKTPKYVTRIEKALLESIYLL